MVASLDLDEEIDLKSLDSNHNSDNSFWEFYRPIMDDFEAKKRLVRTDPETAFRIFNIHKDEELGMLFIDKYRSDEKYNSTAYFISVEMGTPIKRIREPSDFWVYSLEQVENPLRLNLDD